MFNDDDALLLELFSYFFFANNKVKHLIQNKKKEFLHFKL
jgi:hypothetical protein